MRAKILVGFLLLGVIAPVLVTGCGKEEVPPIPTNPAYYTVERGSKFWEFDNLPVATAEPDPDGINYESVSIAGDGAYIQVRFKLPREKHELLTSGYVWVVDEKTRVLYRDVPVVPKIGSLIGKPQSDNQTAYVMLVNIYGAIRSGTLVSVVIGNYKREHVTVQ